MAVYQPQSYHKRNNKKLKWLYAVFLLLVIVIVRMRMQSGGIGPSTIFGRDKSESAPIPSSIEQEDRAFAPQLRLMPESDFGSMRQRPSKPSPKPTEQKTSRPGAPQPSTWILPGPHDPAVEHSPESDSAVAEVMSGLNGKPADIIEARDKLNSMLSGSLSSRQSTSVKKTLAELSEKWLFDKTVYPEDEICSSYKVKPGDNLAGIGKKYKVPYQIIMRINNIKDPRTLRAGKPIKVINGPFHVVVSHSTFTMDLYVQNTYVRSYKVGLGRPEHQTPTGRWRVKPGGKLISPLWRDPDTGKNYHAEDPDYPLGSRWIALEGLEGEAKGRTGFAIHGTRKPEEIGRRSSRGCIRVRDDEVKMVYDLLVPRLSEVVVVD
ncbi:MAG: L,D-transpeptidase family protein [Planctomycetota bacterium]|jgi:lipoprotein-anchoring transpeptidase ErfK/SrfK